MWGWISAALMVWLKKFSSDLLNLQFAGLMTRVWSALKEDLKVFKILV